MRNACVFEDGYRFGFNGQEKDNEVGQGIYTAEFWEYDARIGRRWNLDPKPVIGISDYSCFEGNPIFFNDPLGDKVTYDATKGHSKFITRCKVLIARITDRKFNEDFKKQRDDPTDTYHYRELASNKLDITAKDPSEIGDVNLTTNPNVSSTNKTWKTDDDVKDDIYLSFRTPNEESKTLQGGFRGTDGSNGDDLFWPSDKPKSYISENVYKRGTISFQGSSHDNVGKTHIRIVMKNKEIYREPLSSSNSIDWLFKPVKFVVPFGISGHIKVIIDNPKAPNNAPGSFGLRLRIKSD